MCTNIHNVCDYHVYSISLYINRYLKKCECHEKGQYFLSLISENEIHILYRFITQSQIFQVQFTPCEALPSVWIGFAWPYSQACGHPCCLSTFSYPISFFQSTLHLICFDTALLEHPSLSVMSFGPLPSQQCSPLLSFQRTSDIQNVYCMDGHLLKLKCKYSNIFRYWFLTFISCKL